MHARRNDEERRGRCRYGRDCGGFLRRSAHIETTPMQYTTCNTRQNDVKRAFALISHNKTNGLANHQWCNIENWLTVALGNDNFLFVRSVHGNDKESCNVETLENLVFSISHILNRQQALDNLTSLFHLGFGRKISI